MIDTYPLPAESRTFPSVQGHSLAGSPVRVPEDLGGVLNLVFVAFRQRHQPTINRWLRELGPNEDTQPGLAIYEIPLMRRFPRFYREFIDGGMRAGIRDRGGRQRTVTVYTHRNRFLEMAGLSGTSRPWTVLIDRSGAIKWSHLGGFSPATAAGLRDQMGFLFEASRRSTAEAS